MRVDPDPWLGTILGYQTFRVTAFDSSQGTVPEDRNFKEVFRTSVQGRAFYYTKVPTLNVAHVEGFTRAGFAVVEVNVTFSRQPEPVEHRPNPDVIVKDVEPREHEVVLKIAESSFVYSRFHLDPQIENDSANAVKREWVRNYILGHRGERLLVANYREEPVGFLAVLSTRDDTGNRVRIIDLIAVAKSYQGTGIGRSLVNYFVNDSAEDYSAVKVGTQVANIPSMSFYEKCGFHISETTYVLHAHLFNGNLKQ